MVTVYSSLANYGLGMYKLPAEWTGDGRPADTIYTWEKRHDDVPPTLSVTMHG